MFHELVLHGIGGRTVAEAKENLEATEVRRWVAYIRRHGSLNVGSRVAQSCAIVAMVVARSLGGSKTAKVEDFMPTFDESGEVVDMSEMAGILAAKGSSNVKVSGATNTRSRRQNQRVHATDESGVADGAKNVE